ncbi:copper chaperone PCu(A)C [Kocuria sp. KSNUG]|uniref:copper chaperone PCu(A)C n=1 Tax=Kocuria sp. KSNUG TaxID=3136676 RepID=UPI003C2CB402
MDDQTTTTTLTPALSGRPVHRALAAAAALGLGLAALTGCSAQGGDQAASDSGQGSASQSAAAGPLELSEGWAKAAPSGMTAVFGTVTNTSDQEVTLEGASADGIADDVELHETAMDASSGSTQMQEKDGGFTIAPGESVKLEPGANHIMLMGLTCSLQAGSDLTLQLETGSGAQDVTVPVRDYSGAKENYAPAEDESGASHEHEHEDGADDGEGMTSSPATEDHAGHTGAASPSSSALPECHAH